MATPDDLAREGRLTFARIVELKVDPVEGSFDVAHLREVHRRIFQDLPHHGPGEFRPPTPGHIKNRVLEGTALRYEVPYATRAEVDARLEPTLAALKSGDALRGLDMTGFVAAAATLYGDLDYLHPFREGNSRTLRVFTDQLASATGHDLDWQLTGRDADNRNRLYMARDRAVIDRAYPALDEARALATNDRAEYEAYVTLQTIGSADSLREIVRQSAELGRMRGVPPEGAAMTLSVADARAVLAEHFPTARAQLAAQVESDRIEALRRPAATSRFELGRDILERLDGRDGPAASLNRLEAAGARAITVTIIPGQRALDRVRAVDTAATAALRARDIPDRPADADQAPVSSPAPSPVRGGRDKDRDR